LWSLGVEEQFYIVFPTLLVLLSRFGAMQRSLLVIGIASFALNVVLVRNHTSFAFYLPATRFWEFIPGALLARFYVVGSKSDVQSPPVLDPAS
jgi:peptidoglycan/LPS O-acetylase OafA/YrhL